MKEIPQDEILKQHDVKILELDTRLNSLENLINGIHNKYGLWWEVVDNDKA